MKKKIIFFINDLDFFISHRLRIAQKIDKTKFCVYVCCPRTNKSINILKKNNIKFLKLNLERTKVRFIDEIKTIINITKILYLVKPDIIHLITLKPIVYGGILSVFFKKIKVVYSIAGLGHIFFNEKMYFRRILFVLLLKIAVKFNNSILIFQNRESIKNFKKLKILGKKNRFILTRGSGVDLKIFKPKKKRNKNFTILLASRMVWEKGIKEFFEAYKVLIKKYPELKFVLAGREDPDSPSAISLKYLKNFNSKKNRNFKWIGFKKNIKNLINSSDIVVLPSYHEGAPKVLLEAAACGCPIVATNINGCREIVKNNYNGFLIPLKNSRLLANKIERLYLDKRLYKKMSINSINKANKYFSVEKVIKNHISIYDS